MSWEDILKAGTCYDCNEEFGHMHRLMVAQGYCRNYDPKDPEGPKPGKGLSEEQLQSYIDRGSPVPEPDKARDLKMKERKPDWSDLE